MIPCVRVKEGVQFAVIAPGGFEILAAIQYTAGVIAHDLTITSGTDCEHSGPDDPHHRGEAYDIRSHDLPDKQLALATLMTFLGDVRFYAFLEDEGTENEHIHAQVKKGTVFPPPALSNSEAVQDASAGEN
jgi:hypothetical protein